MDAFLNLFSNVDWYEIWVATGDTLIMLGVSLLCVPLFYSGYRIDRMEGVFLLSLYLTYGLHILAISTGMALAERLETKMLTLVLPVLGVIVAWGTIRAWRRQH
ncbi:K+-dependent Na+/Ca+ exchanger related-protein [Pseudomonas savastanoi pv. glycinea]|nr:K+-dependent Na+/Ca+ exchanger related-protein [Pseudomonas savastanoi pv. glycinea]RMN02421.1 K+-dependent Na+/Ca+ exchanger related-protein [Pseudomonas savastanoi pv. glycinea]RMR49004.1 K+-dependent Na+/Ca+ exchanger related-protein [Pseudomonas savastanoi pv. glycinea]RMU00763.1 K+-dependent Na+/Ca+ exchanger related-protein [Pseudomonas savastanoi pv. glycinea]